MKQESNLNNNISDINDKLNYLEQSLSKELFNHPVRENLIEIRNDLLDYAIALETDLKELGEKVVSYF